MHDRQTTPTTYPSDQTVSELFDAQAERTPTATALVSGTSSMTYRALSERTDLLASHLRAHGVTPGVCVVLAIERSMDLVVAMIATLKAGGAYVPLDLAWPDARMAFILADTHAALVLTDAAHFDRASSWLPTATLDISVATLVDAAIAEAADGRARPVSPTPLDVAYVMYTSGSTGTPRGVEILHRGIVRLAWGLDDVLVLDARQRLLHLASPAFDASTFEIWAALLHGGACIVAGPGVPTARQLGRQLLDHQVTILFLTTALFNAIVDDDPSVLTTVQHVLVGGEALSAAHVRRAQVNAPDTRFSNVYGPTEATAFTSWYSIPAPLDPACRSVPIGRPIGHTDVYLLDAQLMPVSVGAAGELCIGGDKLARGYLGQPTLTAQRFVPRACYEVIGVASARWSMRYAKAR